ncbi:MAG: DUF58 domain-containing protein, partial [Pirellulaceae bacterium]
NDSTAINLGNLKQRGYAVTAILNIHDDYTFSHASAKLLAQGIPVHQLKDEASIPTVCQKYLMR